MSDQTILPVRELQKPLHEAFKSGNRVVVQAPTGSGKSTQIPQMLLDGGLLGTGRVLVLQPRRLAARMLAARVAHERGTPLGGEVGFQIRFEEVSSEATRIEFVTEGILLRRMLGNPSLPSVSAIVFDEFHERHIYSDVSLAKALLLQETLRPDLKIIVMSATLAVESLKKYLSPCEFLSSSGRTFPVAVEYLEKKVDFDAFPAWECAAAEWERVIGKHPAGDTLIFMPGAYEINRTVQAIKSTGRGSDFLVLPLHGELSDSEQDAAVSRHERRKVIVATNVAETSITIDGVTLVIDSGLARVARHDPHRGINTLWVEPVSRASSDQRAGRAGRTAPGLCLRLWTERQHGERKAEEMPEIRRLDLSEIVLALKADGEGDLSRFRWLDAPEEKAIERAGILLHDLGALDAPDGRITPLGRKMLSFPVHPRYARMFLAAGERRCVRAVALIAALMQGRSLLIHSSGRETIERRADILGDGDSDFMPLMRAWRFADRHRYEMGPCRQLGIHAQSARQAGRLFEQFIGIAKREGLEISDTPPDDAAIRECLFLGFSDHLARRLDAGTLRCAMVHGRSGTLSRESVVINSQLLVAAEVREIEQGPKRDLLVILGLVTAVDEAWLAKYFPRDFSEETETVYDAGQRRVVVRREKKFRDLVLESDSKGEPDMEKAAELLAREVVSGKAPLKHWDDAVDQWILRVNTLAAAFPEWDLPAIGDSDRAWLIGQICAGATSYKEIKERDVWPVLRSWLSNTQQATLETFVPERLPMANGRKAKIIYSQDSAPTLSARIQDLYGVSGGLSIADGKIPLVIEILAPNFRPVQITSDLGVFWKESYPKIKQELQRKYPKHEWR